MSDGAEGRDGVHHRTSGNYDVTRDGQRFIVIAGSRLGEFNTGERASSAIDIVLNWFEEVERRVLAK